MIQAVPDNFNDSLDEFFRNDAKAYTKKIAILLACQIEYAEEYQQKINKQRKREEKSKASETASEAADSLSKLGIFKNMDDTS